MRILLAFLAVAFPAIACECRQLKVCELVRLPTIFVGKVIDGGIASIRDDPWYSNVHHVRFQVVENFRGLPAGTQTVDVELAPTLGMCAPIPYYRGRTFLVAPNERNGKFTDGACFQGRDVETAAEDVDQVREYFSGKLATNVHGQVAIARESSLVDFLLTMGETKPLAGVTISTFRGGKAYSAVSDAIGRYTLPLPGGGVYQVRADLKPYVSEPEQISVSGKGCAVHDFGMSVDNTIAGKVWDATGQPLEGAEVGLIDLDRPPPRPDSHAWFDHAYTEAPEMSFTFENVPIGHYLLVFNPDGPRSGAPSDWPFESTYYPSGATRATARTVEVNSGGVHLTGMNMVAGKRVAFRQVMVRVRFPDGTPMKTAEIRCIGLPARAGDLPWIFRKTPLRSENGVVQFPAPANRKLQLEVRDAYGRDLKASYTSAYEPGLTTITQEFVVIP